MDRNSLLHLLVSPLIGAHLVGSLETTSSTTTVFSSTNVTAGLSTNCLAALTSSLNCSSLLTSSDVLYTWGGLTGDDLDELCIDACTESISTFRVNVVDACANDIYTDPSQNATGYVTGTSTTNDIYNVQGVSARPVALVDYYFLNYKLLCLKDDSSTPEYCYLQTGNGTASNETDPCGRCSLEATRLQVEDARMYDDSLAEQYSSSASSCGITTAAITTPSAAFFTASSTANSTTTSCAGSYVAFPTASTCDQVALEYNVGTAQMLSDNGLAAGCAEWSDSNKMQLCIQNSCDTYTVQANDTCTGVAQAHNITLTQLLTWNPTVDPRCVNFDYTVGHVICVSSPLGYEKPNATVADAANPAVTTAAALPSNTAPGSNADCGSWYEVKSGDYCALISTSNGISSSDFYFLNPEVNENCTNLWAGYSYCVEAVGSISTYSGYGVKSTISASAAGSTSEVVTATTTYNVSTLTATAAPVYNFTTTSSLPLASGSISDCYETFENVYGEMSCALFVRRYGVSYSDFLRWNPSLQGNYSSILDCTMQNNTAYCAAFYNIDYYPSTTTTAYVAVPTDATANATNECSEWYETESGDTCASILDEFEIPFSSFYEWNPAVGSNCENLWMNASYCVQGPGWEYVRGINATAISNGSAQASTSLVSAAAGVTSSTGTTSTSSDPTVTPASSTTASIGTSIYTTPPGPTQTGIVSNCDLYAEPISGDGCSSFAQRYNITLDQFYEWNPAVGECSAFWSGEAYCVGVSGVSS